MMTNEWLVTVATLPVFTGVFVYRVSVV